MDGWRFLVQQQPGGVITATDLPLTNAKTQRFLSAPGRLTARFTPTRQFPASLLRPYKSCVFVERGSQFIGGGILTPLKPGVSYLELDCFGLSGFAARKPWKLPAEYLIEQDVFDIVRKAWAFIQAQPGGNLGLLLDPHKAGIKVGVPEQFTDAAGKTQPARSWMTTLHDDKGNPFGAWFIDPSGSRVAAPNVWGVKYGDPYPSGQGAHWVNSEGVPQSAAPNFWVDGDGDIQPAPPNPATRPKWRHYQPGCTSHGSQDAGVPSGWQILSPGAPDFWVDIDGTHIIIQSGVPPAGAKHYTAQNPPPGWTKYDAYNLPKGWKRHTTSSLPEGWTYTPAEPVTLEPWSTYDLGRLIDQLAEGHFDYREETEWATSDKKALTHRLRLGSPTLGTRQTGITAPRFVVGENVTTWPTFTVDDDDYASEIVAYGAGEGAAMIRADIPVPTANGLWNPRLLVDKTARSATQLITTARAEFPWLTGDARLQSFTVKDSPLARIGTYQVGDQVRIAGHKNAPINLDRWAQIVGLENTQDRPDEEVVTVREV